MKFEIGDRIIGKPHAYSNPLLGTFVKYSEWKNTVNVRFDTVSYESPDQTSLVSLEDIEPATKLALLLLGLDNEV